MKLDHCLIPYTINSKWTTLIVKPKPIQILEENIGSKLSDIVCSNILSARETKE